MTSAQELLSRLDYSGKSQQEKGELFERFVIAYLRRAGCCGQQFASVWRWHDWPGRGNEIDSGIDIVAEEAGTGTLWAIQVKLHEAPLGLHDIATFLALSGRKDFACRMLVTSSPLGPQAENALEKQEKEVRVLTLADILQSPIDWDTFDWRKPEDFSFRPPKELRPYQKDAVEMVLSGFGRSDRGKLIMPPGAGKTFVALKIAEKLVGAGGYVLFLAPSIALVEQTLWAWLADADVSLRVYAVTSDYTVGRDEDSLERTTILTIPPTTESAKLAAAAGKPDPNKMTVIVSTYQSIDVVAEAQKLGLPDFGLIIADEAHRTTGIMQGAEASYYHQVHDNNVVRGAKRLYMTATPRIFIPRIKEKLEELGYDYFTMDDQTVYGEEFFRYGFGQAVDEGFLSDYKVVVFTVSEADVQRKLFEFLSQGEAPQVEEAAKIIGVWSALSGRAENDRIPPLKRAVIFAGRIADSKNFAREFARTAEAYYEESEDESEFRRFEVRHVDGTMTATERKALLDWLRDEPAPGEARVLSNARVLTEGIDVPALDAVVFLKPRRSVVEVVQAVGRAMRKAPGKRYGYVILPVIVKPERDAAEQLDKNEEFRTVWEVLGALRSIDDRFDAMVRELSIQRGSKKQDGDKGPAADDGDIIVITNPKQIPIDFGEELYEAILAKFVERVGDRAYLETWANDVAAATLRIERHIAEALQHDSDYGEKAREAFTGFLTALREVINPFVTEEEARSMLVQHIITKPIFDAVFGGYEFLKDNPVAYSFEQLGQLFEAFISKETQTLKSFYRLVQIRARGLNKETERQDFLRLLYDTFFRIAFPKTAKRLGIVFTPVEVVDFLVKSTEALLQDEFGLSLEDEKVVILEPFSGTGTFLARLMHCLSPEALERKYREGEIWGNEILLLPYYIALANVESTYYEITGRHEPFHNLLLVDSFQLMEEEKAGQITLFPEQYTELMRKQREAQINVIVSNPPWFAKQEEENLGIKAVKYDRLDRQISKTYAASSSATNKNSLYDAYIRAIRMATDRIDDKGVIAFVSNSGFLDGTAADGLRKCLAEEFAKIYVVNLRGNARTSGELRRKEGGGIFDQGSRAGVALLILVKDISKTGPAEIYYHDIGDYLSREEKLARLKMYGDIRKVMWERIYPNRAYDWISQRSEEFMSFLPVGEKGSTTGKAIFEVYSRGLETTRDAWVYSFSSEAVRLNMEKMISVYNKNLDLVLVGKAHKGNIDQMIDNDPKMISWCSSLKQKLLSGERYEFNDAGETMHSIYRPFVKMFVYFSRAFNHRVGLLPRIFPEPGVENITITVEGVGSTKEFSVLITKHIPDIQLLYNGQTFPFYTYDELTPNSLNIFDNCSDSEIVLTAPSGKRYIRRENITDWILAEYRRRYGESIAKEDIFYYVYGLLHSPEYRERYGNDLKKMLPRIPFVATPEDFWAFSQAGRELAQLHLNYETVEPWPLEEEIKGNPDDPATYRVVKMRFAKMASKKQDKTVIIYNDHITLRGIPLEAYEYVVNGKSAIEWIMERYQVLQDENSGIVNDPNKWLEEHNDPRYIIELIKRGVRISIETIKVIKKLPRLNVHWEQV